MGKLQRHLDQDTATKAPGKPTLGLIKLEGGKPVSHAFPIGSVFFITDGDKKIAMALKHVAAGALHFKCPCGGERCTRTYRLKLDPSGEHHGPQTMQFADQQ